MDEPKIVEEETQAEQGMLDPDDCDKISSAAEEEEKEITSQVKDSSPNLPIEEEPQRMEENSTNTILTTEEEVKKENREEKTDWKCAEFGEGSLGLTMRRTKRDTIYVFEVTGQAEAKGLKPGDEIVQLGDFVLVSGSVNKEIWRRAVEYVKEQPRPLSIWYIPKKEDQMLPTVQPDPIELALRTARRRVVLVRDRLVWSEQVLRGRKVVDTCESVVFEGWLTVCQKRSRLRSFASMVVGGDGFQRFERYGFVLRGTQNVLIICETTRSSTEGSTKQQPKKLPVARCIVLDSCVKLQSNSELFLEISSPELQDGGLCFGFSEEKEAMLWRGILANTLLSCGRDSGATKREVLDRCDTDRDALWRHHMLLGTSLSVAAAAPVVVTTKSDDTAMSCETPYATINDIIHLDARDARGRSALHIASARGATDLVRTLLVLGARAHALDDRKSTPLHEACRGRHDATVSLLLAIGGGTGTTNLVDARDDRGLTPFDACGDGVLKDTEESAERLSRTMLALSAWGGGVDCPRDAWGLCLSHRLARSRNPIALQLACKHGEAQATAKLLAAPSPVDYLYDVDPLFSAEILKRGATGLHIALGAEAVDSLNRDLGLRADYESETSALARCVDVLLHLAVDPFESDSDGQTAINLAVDFLVAANAPCSEALRLALCGPLAYFDDDMSASSAAPTSKKSLTETIRAAAKAAVKILEKKKKIAPAASWNQVVETLDDILTKRKARTPGAKKRLGSWLAKLAGQSTSEEATPTASSESEDQLSQPTATKITTTPNFASRAYRKSATDEQYRKELFGRAPEDSAPLSTKEKVEATTSDFDGLKDAMNERGERLTKLSDKAEELASASEEFEKMCARLNREKQRGTGWW